jgi:lysyl-tRNA synthetase class 2
MPPTTGTGIGIDRFVALITGSHTLRETMAFPMMKPVEVEDN